MTKRRFDSSLLPEVYELLRAHNGCVATSKVIKDLNGLCELHVFWTEGSEVDDSMFPGSPIEETNSDHTPTTAPGKGQRGGEV